MAAFDQGSLSVCHQVLRWSIRKETLTQNDSFVHPEELTDCNRQRHLQKVIYMCYYLFSWSIMKTCNSLYTSQDVCTQSKRLFIDASEWRTTDDIFAEMSMTDHTIQENHENDDQTPKSPKGGINPTTTRIRINSCHRKGCSCDTLSVMLLLFLHQTVWTIKSL